MGNDNDKSFVSKIISNIMSIINDYSYRRLTSDSYIDPEAVLADMRDNGDRNLGTYATRTYFSRKNNFTRR